MTSNDLPTRRRWEDIVKNYLDTLNKDPKDYRMNTKKSYVRTVQSFFSKLHVALEYSKNELKFEPSQKEKVSKEWIPSNEEIRLLYRMANTTRDRAILLTLYQSGFSEVDVCSMKIEDFAFYEQNGDWRLSLNEDLYHERLREKTNISQKTCISREALEEIRIMLQSRGFPKQGFLYLTQKNNQLENRDLHDMFKALITKAYSGRAAQWKTKHLRDAFMNGCLQARIPQEVKDSMVGHKREGARENYGLTEQTIKGAYTEAFKFLTINGFGQTSRKIEELQLDFQKTKNELVELITELRTENKTLKQQLDSNSHTQRPLHISLKDPFLSPVKQLFEPVFD
jgi:integrase